MFCLLTASVCKAALFLVVSNSGHIVYTLWLNFNGIASAFSIYLLVYLVFILTLQFNECLQEYAGFVVVFRLD